MSNTATGETLTGKSFIGAGRGAAANGTFYATDPANGEQIGPAYYAASAQEADDAVKRAHEAFFVYRKSTGVVRAGFLRKIVGNLNTMSDQIVARMNTETALPQARAMSELTRTCAQLQMFAKLAEDGEWVDARVERADRSRLPIPKPDMRSMLQPIGPVVVLGPANFPLAFSVAGGDTASALAVGCPVVVKAHPKHPGTSELVGIAVRNAVRDSGLHDGVFSLLFDDGIDVAAALVKHPFTAAVGFTGSRRAGRALMDIAAARPRPIPVFAEMSSLNPLFILPGALRARPTDIARGLHNSITLGVGQFCTRPGLAVLQDGEGADELIDVLAKLVSATAPGAMLSQQIRDAYGASVSRLKPWEKAAANPPGHSTAEQKGCAGYATLIEVDATVFLRKPELSEEVFGPTTTVVRCASRQELMAVAAHLDGNLTATIHGEATELPEYRDLFELLETKAGRLVLNGFPTGLEVGPATVHGGPYPATSDSRFTAIGTAAIQRFVRPVCYQDCAQSMLSPELRD